VGLIKLVFKAEVLRTTRERLCLRVLDYFKVPQLRLLCYLDDTNPEYLRKTVGAFLCGIHGPVVGSGHLPEYVTSLFFDYSTGDIAFDNFVYLCGFATETDIGTVITFAHELQHFVQYGWTRKIANANTILYHNLLSFEPALDAKPWDIPSEREAMIVSKRIAQAILGADRVQEFTEAQIRARRDPAKWEFFGQLTADTQYDLLKGTDTLVRKYRDQLVAFAAGHGKPRSFLVRFFLRRVVEMT